MIGAVIGLLCLFCGAALGCVALWIYAEQRYYQGHTRGYLDAVIEFTEDNDIVVKTRPYDWTGEA